MILDLSIKVPPTAGIVTNCLAFLSVTNSKARDNTADQALELSRGNIIVMGRLYNDYARHNQAQSHHNYFVTRLKKNARYRVIEHRKVYLLKRQSIVQPIALTGIHTDHCPITARRIDLKDAETDVHCYFLINNFELAATTIAGIYKARWQIELFFNWIKQNLKTKSFFDTYENTIVPQTWLTVFVNLFLSYLQFISRLSTRLQQMFRPFQFNLLEWHDLLGPAERGSI